MNSAEKKSSEPSMDDIISSIRNIIADDTQESAAAPNVEIAQKTLAPAPAPVVQLTENQIAQPVAAPVVSQTPMVQAPPPIPEAVATPEPVIHADPAPAPRTLLADVSAQIANEIDAVPGAGLETPNQSPPQSQGFPPIARQTELVEAPVMPSIDMGSPQVNSPVEPVGIPMVPVTAAATATVAPVPLTVEMAPMASMPAPVEAVIPVDPMVPQNPLGAMPQAGIAPPPLQVPLIPALDPVSFVPAGDVDEVNNGIDPDKILEGMDGLAHETAAPVLPPEYQVAPQEISAQIEEPPTVLDASQVSAEDAAAISAVAAATSEALAGRSEPKVEKEGCKSLEDSVKAMLKPMIREWLDDNMPRILEGAVKEEVNAPDNDDT